MRQANTTYVNLRFTLDELDPFVEASKPVAKRLRPYLAELRPFAREAVPTVRDMSTVIRKPGDSNDLTELNRTYPGLKDIALVERPRGRSTSARARSMSASAAAHSRSCSEALTDSAPDRRPRTSLHDRPVRLVRRLLAHRRLRRARVVQPRADVLQRLHGVGGSPGPAAPAARQGRRLPPDRQAAPGQALPGRQRGGPPRTARTSGARRTRRSSTASRPTAPRGRSSETRAVCARRRRDGGGGSRVLTGASDPERSLKTYEIEFDNAFGLVEGGDLKIGGVKAGQTTGFRLTKTEPYRVIVTVEVTEPGFERLRTDAECAVRQQSLIGEYFVDCDARLARRARAGRWRPRPGRARPPRRSRPTSSTRSCGGPTASASG